MIYTYFKLLLFLQIPIGVYLNNENKLNEMAIILQSLMSMVPTLHNEESVPLSDGNTVTVDKTTFHKVLLGGDQLTAARVRGTKSLKQIETRAVDRSQGLIPVVEDWHARMAFVTVSNFLFIYCSMLIMLFNILLQAIWKQLFSSRSSMDKGTMFQLKNLINRKNVPNDPTKNMNAAEDFLLLLLHAHVVSSAEAIISEVSVESVADLAKLIVVNYIKFPEWNVDVSEKSDTTDLVHEYAKELLSLSLFWHGFHDATREADGEHLLRYWKFFLVVFKASKQYNYGKEAVNLLFQCYYVFSERQKSELLWSRCINTKGYAGANISCDLHMEHLNCRLKIIMRNIGANLSPVSIEKAGKSIATVQHICETFEQQTTAQSTSQKHPFPSFGKDLTKILDLLREENVSFPAVHANTHPSNSRSHYFIHWTKKILKKKS